MAVRQRTWLNLFVGVFTFIFINACQPHTADLYVSSNPALNSFDGDGPINRTREGIALKGYDVVAFFTEGKPIKGSEEIEADYKEATFRFSSTENRKRFLENPEQYLPAYGGFCALGVANGYKDDMHPKAFTIVDGRLFFNLTPRIHHYWKIDPKRHIQRADEKWPQLKTAPGHGPADGR